MLSKRILLAFLGAALSTLSHSAQAQSTKIPRIGYLIVPSLSMNANRIEALRQGLRELGYIDGKSIVMELRSADGKLERLPALAAELVQRKVDIIVSAGPTATRAVKEATTYIPIVMAQDTDPVGNGFIASLAHPGGNITGLSNLAPEIGGKQLELLKEIVPRLSRVAAIGESGNPGHAQQRKEAERAAVAFKVRLQNLDIRDPGNLAAVFEAAHHERADAALIFGGPLVVSQRAKIVGLVAKFRLPTSTTNKPSWMPAGS